MGWLRCIWNSSSTNPDHPWCPKEAITVMKGYAYCAEHLALVQQRENERFERELAARESIHKANMERINRMYPKATVDPQHPGLVFYEEPRRWWQFWKPWTTYSR